MFFKVMLISYTISIPKANIFIGINSQLIKYKYILLCMQEREWRRSADPTDLGIDEATLNIIKNTLLGYNYNSQFYLDIPQKHYLNIILFLILYDSNTMKTKKIQRVLGRIIKEQLQELNSQYFTTHDDTQLNITKRVEQVSSKFYNHSPLIERIYDKFLELSPNSIFEKEAYKNKLQIREFIDGQLVPFNQISFNSKTQARNDLILIPHQTGYYLACYSTHKKANHMNESNKKELKKSKKVESPMKGKEKISKENSQEQILDQEEKMQPNISQKKQRGQVRLKKAKKSDVQEDEQQELITFTILSLILLTLSFEVYGIFSG